MASLTVQKVPRAKSLFLAGLCTVLAVLAGCGEGTGEIKNDDPIEARLAEGMKDYADDGYEYEVDCPEGIEAGTDFSCTAYPRGEDAVYARLKAHLGDDGESLGTIEVDRVLRDR